MEQKHRPTIPDPQGREPQPQGGPVEPGTRLGGRFVLLDYLGAGGGAVVVPLPRTYSDDRIDPRAAARTTASRSARSGLATTARST